MLYTWLCLTHWGRDKIAAFPRKHFQMHVFLMKMYEFCLRFHWGLFLRLELTILPHCFRQWLCADQATSHSSHYLNQWWLVYWCISVTRPQWVKQAYHCKMKPSHHSSDLTWGPYHLKLLANNLFVQQLISANNSGNKITHYWPFVRGLHGNGWIPLKWLEIQKALPCHFPSWLFGK